MGLPSRFGEWCDQVIAHLARRSLGKIEVAAADTLDAVGSAFIRAKAPHLLIVARRPVVELQTQIRESKHRSVIALCDPRSALGYLQRHPGWDLVTATRVVANGCAAMHALTAAPDSLLLTARAVEDAAATAGTIAAHLQLPLDAVEIAAVVTALDKAGIRPEDPDDQLSWARFDGREQAIARGALQPYISYFGTGSDLEPFVWERELFWIFEDPPTGVQVPATRPVDLTGRARVLVYGPHINLPAGSWLATIALAFSAEAAGTRFTIEAYAGERLASADLLPVAAKILEANLLFTINASLDRAVEIRVLSEQSPLNGRLALGGVTLTPRAQNMHDESRKYLARVVQSDPATTP
jgi:hypothetical protein